MSDSDEIDELEDLTGTHYKRLHSFGFRRIRIAYFPSTDQMQKNFEGKWEIYLRNPTRNKLAIALTKTNELRWVYFEGVSYWVNAHLTTHFDLAKDVGETHAQNAIGGFLTPQMLANIPPGTDMREWEMDHATAVR